MSVQPGGSREQVLKVAALLLLLAIISWVLGIRTEQAPSVLTSNTQGSKPTPQFQQRMVRHEPHRIILETQDGDEVWQKRMEDIVYLCELVDLEGDGDEEVIVGLQGEDTAAGGQIQVLAEDGSLLWSYRLTNTSPFDMSSSGKMAFDAFDILQAGKESFILIDARDAHGWAPSSLVVLTSTGQEIGRVWHPGHLVDITIAELEARSPKILVSAISNHLTDGVQRFADGHPRVLFQIDFHRMIDSFQQTTPSVEAIIDWYKLISPVPHTIFRLDVLASARSPGKMISVWTTHGIAWSLAFDGTVISQETDDSFSGDFGELVAIPPHETDIRLAAGRLQ